MGARSWCERRSQPPPQSQSHHHHHHHHTRNSNNNNNQPPQQQQEAQDHPASFHEEEEDYGRRLSPPPAPLSPLAPLAPGTPPAAATAHQYRAKERLLQLQQKRAFSSACISRVFSTEKPTAPVKPGSRTNSPPAPFEPSAMYTASTVKERERLEAGLLRDRQVRLHSVQTDILLDLPPAIALPDGEEHPAATHHHHPHHQLHHQQHQQHPGSCFKAAAYGVHLIHLRDPEQESEIYRGYIRPPPNRTALERGSSRDALPPYPHPPPPYASPSSSSSLASSLAGSLGVGLYHPKQHSPPPPPSLPPATSLRYDFMTDANLRTTTATTRHLAAATRQDLKHGLPRAPRYGSPPSYSQVTAAATTTATTDLKTKTKKLDGNRTARDDEVRLLPDDDPDDLADDDLADDPDERPPACYESACYDEFSDSPPSYSDIVGSAAPSFEPGFEPAFEAAFEPAPLIGREQRGRDDV